MLDDKRRTDTAGAPPLAQACCCPPCDTPDSGRGTDLRHGHGTRPHDGQDARGTGPRDDSHDASGEPQRPDGSDAPTPAQPRGE
jgi:hypothetical protein